MLLFHKNLLSAANVVAEQRMRLLRKAKNRISYRITIPSEYTADYGAKMSIPTIFGPHYGRDFPNSVAFAQPTDLLGYVDFIRDFTCRPL